MASLLGFGKKKNVTQNGVFIQRQMMPLMLKLHKETKGRRYKVSEHQRRDDGSGHASFFPGFLNSRICVL